MVNFSLLFRQWILFYFVFNWFILILIFAVFTLKFAVIYPGGNIFYLFWCWIWIYRCGHYGHIKKV